MASTSSLQSSLLVFNPFSHTRPSISSERQKVSMKIFALRKDTQDHYRGKLVDESLIVLRKRIHEMKMIERNYEPPTEWMDWEKKIYTSYDSLICEAMGLLQCKLMETRPSLVLGMMALVALSVPTSTAVVMLHLVNTIRAALSGIHLG